MNYRHAFHAGNFADVVKHAVLARILHLKEKPAAFRVIDTHAGAGLYDLAGPRRAGAANGARASDGLSPRSLRGRCGLALALSRSRRRSQRRGGSRSIPARPR